MQVESNTNTYLLAGDIIENNLKERYLVIGYLYIKSEQNPWELDCIIRNSRNFDEFKLQYLSSFIISYTALRLENGTIEETLSKNNKPVAITQVPMYTTVSKYKDIKKIETYILKQRLLNKVERRIYTESELDEVISKIYEQNKKKLYNYFKLNFTKVAYEDFMQDGGLYVIQYRNKPYIMIKKGYKYGVLKRIEKYNDIYEAVHKIRDNCCYFLDEDKCKVSISIRVIEKLLKIEIKWIKSVNMDNVYVLSEDIEELFY